MAKEMNNQANLRSILKYKPGICDTALRVLHLMRWVMHLLPVVVWQWHYLLPHCFAELCLREGTHEQYFFRVMLWMHGLNRSIYVKSYRSTDVSSVCSEIQTLLFVVIASSRLQQPSQSSQKSRPNHSVCNYNECGFICFSGKIEICILHCHRFI